MAVRKPGSRNKDLGFSRAALVVVFALLLAPQSWLLDPAFGQQPQTHDVSKTEPLFPTNAAWTNGWAPGYWATKGTSLTLNISSGTSPRCPDGTIISYAGGTLSMADNTTNYVYLDSASSCAPASTTSALVSGQIPIAKVVTSGGAITAITDLRSLNFSGGGGGTPCVTTASSLQYDNAGAFGCVADFTFSGHTITSGASGILDLGAASATAGFKIPSVAGAVPTADGFIATNTTNHTHVWGSNGTTMVGAIAATGTGTATTCSNKFVRAVSSVVVPTCDSVAAADMAVSNTLRACVINNDTQSAQALVAANFSGNCIVPAAGTIVEIDVIGGTGTLTGSASAPTVTGTSSVKVGIYTPSSAASTTSVLSAALATASGQACALIAAGSATCPIMGITQAGAGLSISTTTLTAGDVLYVSAATADGAQTWFTVEVFWKVN